MIIWKLCESVMRFVVGVDARITFAVAAEARHLVEYSISPWNGRIQLYNCWKRLRVCDEMEQRNWCG